MSAQEETRVEQLTETLDGFITATVLLREAENDNCPRKERDRLTADHADARAELKLALREFTRPLVRLIEGHAQDTGKGDDAVKCPECGAMASCNPGKCGHWAAAIREKIDTAKLESEDGDEEDICKFCNLDRNLGGVCDHKDCPHGEEPRFA